MLCKLGKFASLSLHLLHVPPHHEKGTSLISLIVQLLVTFNWIISFASWWKIDKESFQQATNQAKTVLWRKTPSVTVRWIVMVDDKNRPSCRLIEYGIQKKVEKLPLYKRQCKSRKKYRLDFPAVVGCNFANGQRLTR